MQNVDIVLKLIFLYGNGYIFIHMSLISVPSGSIKSYPILSQRVVTSHIYYMSKWWPSHLTHRCVTWLRRLNANLINRIPYHGKWNPNIISRFAHKDCTHPSHLQCVVNRRVIYIPSISRRSWGYGLLNSTILYSWPNIARPHVIFRLVIKIDTLVPDEISQHFTYIWNTFSWQKT